jgi:23S rRNA (pseudouridine1915-N3)-methyltransferase
MNIQIICVGKIKEKFMREAIVYYKNLITIKNKLEIIELEDEKTPNILNSAEVKLVKQKESNKILSKIQKNDFVVLLDIYGKAITTEQFKKSCSNNEKIVFVIGGSLGVSENVRNRANIKISISNMTFPHQLMRIILLEQIKQL